jgi:hypothetical protein
MTTLQCKATLSPDRHGVTVYCVCVLKDVHNTEVCMVSSLGSSAEKAALDQGGENI